MTERENADPAAGSAAGQLPPRTGEAGYRQGYTDGYLAGVRAFYDALTQENLPSDRAEAVLAALADFHADVLAAWRDGDASAAAEPPKFEGLAAG